MCARARVTEVERAAVNRGGCCLRLVAAMRPRCAATLARRAHVVAALCAQRHPDPLPHPLRRLSRRARAALDRYTHYFERYINHRRSMDIGQRTLEATSAKLDGLQSTGLYKASEVQFLLGGCQQKGAGLAFPHS